MANILEKSAIESENTQICSSNFEVGNFFVPEEETNDTEDATTLETGSKVGNDVGFFCCSLCGFEGESREEQISHYQSGWHVLNLKLRLKGAVPVTEEDFDDNDWEEDVETFSEDATQEECSRETSVLARLNKSSPRFVFLKRNTECVYSIYKCLFDNVNQCQLSEIPAIQRSTTWCVLLVSGGRFAGAVFDGSEPVVHKTFHRYTVRAGQGGAQGSRDGQNAQRAPKSAGAGLRRYNEAALANDIQGLLAAWKGLLEKCSRVFLRYSTYHRGIFFGGSTPPFSKDDKRLRTVPFASGKPSFEELKRVQRKLSTVYSHGELKQLAEQLPKPKTLNPIQPPKSSPATVESCSEESDDEVRKESKPRRRKKIEAPEIDEALPSVSVALKQEIYTACKIGEKESLERVLNDLPELERNYVLNEKTGAAKESLLHHASAAGQKDVVRVLLSFGASPLIKNAHDKLPYQLGKDRDTKMVFRRFRQEHPSRWDWDLASVPLPLSAEEEQMREAKTAERNRAAKLARKEKQKAKKAEEAVERAEAEEKGRYLALSDREKRALAAERRLLERNSAAVCKRCFACAKDISGLVPFEYSANVFCSIHCLKAHRNAVEP